jgi:hypothetical protein
MRLLLSCGCAEPLGVGSNVVSPTFAMRSQSAAPDDVERVWPHGLGELPTWVSVAMRVPANAVANAGFVFYAFSHQVCAWMGGGGGVGKPPCSPHAAVRAVYCSGHQCVRVIVCARSALSRMLVRCSRHASLSLHLCVLR